ncbi:MFS transporter [Parasedimentitalea maritima]|nr:MFS transporter [Zongyanglinia marina]
MTDFQETAPVGWHEILNRDYAAPLVLVCLGVWLHAADSLLVATMMPNIVSDLGGEAYVAWSIALYEIGSIVAGASGAVLVLKMGIRQPMFIAAITFALGCLISAAAFNMPGLLAGRLFQGMGGGGLTALAFIGTGRLFPARLIARVMGAISVLWGSSAFLGPLIGGVFTTYFNWRMGFVFFAIQALFLATFVLFGSRVSEATDNQDRSKPIPVARLLLLSLGVLFIAYAGIEVTALRTPVLLACGLGILATFMVIDGNSPGNRILPKQLFNPRSPVGAALLMTFTLNISTMGLSAYGPLLMVIIHNTPTIVAGYILACVAIGWSCAALIVSGAPEKHDPIYIAVGIALVCISVIGMIYAVANGPVLLVAALATLEGVGYGTAWTFIVRRSKRLAAADDVERLSGALPTTGRLGFAVGASVCGILANYAGFSIDGSADAARTVARTIFTGSLPFAFLAMFAMVCFVSMKPKSTHPKQG